MSKFVKHLTEDLSQPKVTEGFQVGDMVRIDLKKLTPVERGDVRQVGGDMVREVLQVQRDGKVRIGRPGSPRVVQNLSDLVMDPKVLIPEGQEETGNLTEAAAGTWAAALDKAGNDFIMAAWKKAVSKAKAKMDKPRVFGTIPGFAFSGTDASDFEIKGGISVFPSREGTEAVIDGSREGGMRDNVKLSRRVKAGVLTVDMLADMIVELLYG